MRVKTVDLSSTDLTSDQLTAICQRITGEKNLALEKLVLDGNCELRRVNKALLDEAKKVVKIMGL